MRKRLFYLLLTLLLIATEVFIALFVHDDFIRPYIGDVLVVIVLYTFVRIFIPEKCGSLPLYIFIFAAATELMQYFHIVELLGLQNNDFFRVLIGSVADIKDIACYFVGCAFLGAVELLRRNKK